MNDVLTPRILFLDIDGVCNRDNTYYSKEPIDRTLVHRVGDMVQRLGAQIVISSDWRHHHSIGDLRKILYHFGGISPRRIVGTTHIPHEQGDGIRGREIAQWLDAFGPARVAILDDNHRGRFNMDGVREWFVKTDPAKGVTPENIRCATTLLTTGPIYQRKAIAA